MKPDDQNRHRPPIKIDDGGVTAQLEQIRRDLGLPLANFVLNREKREKAKEIDGGAAATAPRS